MQGKASDIGALSGSDHRPVRSSNPGPLNRIKQPCTVAIYTGDEGGVFVYSARLAVELGRLGYAVDVITHPTTNRPAQLRIAELESSCRVHYVPLSDDLGERVTNLASKLEEVAADVIIPNYRSATYAACARLSQRKKTKIVGVCHNDHEDYYQLLSRYESIVGSFVCPSSATLRILATRIPHRIGDIHYVPHGVPSPHSANASFSGGEIVLVYHGRLTEEQKHVSSLVELAEALRDRQVPFRLRLVGDGDDRRRYEQQVAHRGLEDRVEFLGDLPWDSLTDVLRKSHVAVLASKYEGFCLSLAEAMGTGLPAVAFASSGAIEEYLKHGVNGFVVPWGEVGLMAKRIEWLQQNPKAWKELSVAAHRVIRADYSLDRFGQRTASCVDELAGVNTARSWPRLRPVIVAKRKSVSNLMERCGRVAGAWR